MMIIGSLLDDQLGRKVKYSYCHRGMNTQYLPDKICEEQEKECYDAACGNLFFKRDVAWNETVLLQGSIDIRITLEERCFVDHVTLKQGADSSLQSVEVFTMADEEYMKIGSYQPESGGMITTPSFSVQVGSWCDNVVVRLNGNCKPVHILKMDVWAAWDLENTIWPVPAKADYSKESLPLSSLQSVRAAGADAQFAAKYLCEKMSEKAGYAPVITETAGDITFFTTEKDEKDGFSLKVSEEGCVIRAGSRRSMLYAADALVQLIDGKKIRCADIVDEAFVDYRGVHFALPNRDQEEFLKKLVKYVFVPLRYNQIYLQISAAMRYDNYPEINEAWLKACELFEEKKGPKPAHYGFISRNIWEKAEVRELCAYFKSFGLEVIPEVQSWGHTQYITMAYPYLAEIEEEVENDKMVNLHSEDYRPDTRYYHTMCPNHPDYYQVIFGILEEVLEAVQPERFVHMGHDEIYSTGKCAVCKKLSGGDIFATEVNKLNTYIKQKGLRMMIWADMLQQQKYATPTAINKVDKDIILLDFVWYFHLDEEIEDHLLDHGFQVIMGNMYSSHYPRLARRIHKKGMLGGEVSTWVPCNEFSYAYEGKMFDFFLSSETLWNSDYRDEMRLTYHEMIKPLISDARRKIGNLICAGEECRIALGGCSKNIPYDIRGLEPFGSAVKVTAACPEAVIAVNAAAEVINFTHATDKGSERVMWQKPFKIGSYRICYEDGSEVTEGLFYAANIYKYDAPFGDIITSPLFRHEGYAGTYLCLPVCGKTYEGKDYTLGKYSMRNPYPEKKIKTVKIQHAGNTDAAIILFDLTVQ